jgi:tRNA A37 methylthiotransferase MiaB
MVPKVPERIAGERAAELRTIASEAKMRYMGSYLGRKLDVLAEEYDPQAGSWKGLSENYLSVRIEKPAEKESVDILRGRRYPIIARYIRDNILIGSFS